MHIKIINTAEHTERVFPCLHYTKTAIVTPEVAKRYNATLGGLVLEPVPGPILRLPEDGDIVYVENDAGKTIEAYKIQKTEPAPAEPTPEPAPAPAESVPTPVAPGGEVTP